MAPISATGFIDTLREYRILDSVQLEKLTRALKGRDLDPRGIARELLKHNWLTSYQANQLLQGHGAELVLGPYLLLDRLGEGGMGQVFKARHQLMNRIVAIKVIRKERLTNPDAVERFHREIRLAAQLDSPHLVRAHDAAQVGDLHFLVMEYVEGTDLQNLVQKSGPLPLGKACSYIRQAALGLQDAWERGLVHRDIKPSNLQLTTAGEVVKILDMGLARSSGPEEAEKGKGALTQACSIMGTPDYMAPEQIVDARQVDVRADIYSLGCTLYFLLAGRPPFPGGAWEEKLVCHRKVEPQPLEQIRPDVPPAFVAVLRRMMAKRPEDRYGTPASVADALAPFATFTPATSAQQTAEEPILATVVHAPAASGLAAAASLVNDRASNEPGWTLTTPSTLATARPAVVDTAIQQPSATPTVLIPVQHSSTQTPQPQARKKIWLALAGCAFLGMTCVVLATVLAVMLWQRDGDKQEADAKPGASANGKKDGLPAGGPAILVDEDFRTPYQKKLTIPEGWEEGEAYRIIKEEEMYALEISKPNGIHSVRLPPVALSGDFFIEGVYFLDRYAQRFTVSLENRLRSAALPITFVWDGSVLLGDDRRLPPQGYTSVKPTHFLIKREGKRLRVFLDKNPVADKELEELADYTTIRLSLSAGAGANRRLARLYGIKVGTLGTDGNMPPSNLKSPEAGRGSKGQSPRPGAPSRSKGSPR